MSSIKGAWQELLVSLGLDLGLVFMVFWSILVLWWDRLGFGCTRLTGESGAAGGSAEDRRRRPRKSAGCVWWRRADLYQGQGNQATLGVLRNCKE